MTAPSTPSKNDREDRLDELIAKYLQAGSDQKPHLRQTYLIEHPALTPEQEEFFADQDRFCRLADPLRLVMAAVTVPPPGSSIGDYEILEEIAQGGMGVIYKARSKSLGRIVALKCLRAGTFASHLNVQRFRSEAEAVALLDHPHIVPIYEVGEHQGQPFFSMRLMEGGSLAEHLPEYSLSDPNGESRHSRNPSQIQKKRDCLLRLMVPICRAVHFAHQRGILHRDLKPGNILLDDQGQPYVTDFGLAKKVLPDEDTPAQLPLTQSGSILGTPSYMAPEQADGTKGSVTTAADVYSLGAILYELLTGKPPFRGSSAFDILRQLSDQEAAPPRNLNPFLDRDLETICLKCLSKEPSKRYSNAEELADELKRIQTGEPIKARPVSTVKRMGIWLRRNTALATAIGLAIATLLVLGIGGLLFGLQEARYSRDLEVAAKQLRKEQKQTRLALLQVKLKGDLAEKNFQDAKKHKEAAERNFQQAHDMVNDFYFRISEKMRDIPNLQNVRKELLQKALTYYREFIKEQANDNSLRRELAETYRRVGEITTQIGSRKEALLPLQKALEIYQELHQKNRTDKGIRTKLSELHLNIGHQNSHLGNLNQAMISLQKARSLYEGLCDQYPKEPDFLNGLAYVITNQGSIYERQGDPAKAEKYLLKSLAIRKKLTKEHPKNFQYQIDLGLSYNNAGVMNAIKGRIPDGLKYFQLAAKIREPLAKKFPKKPKRQLDLAASYRDIGMAQLQLYRQDDCLMSWEKALSIRGRVAKENPQVHAYQSILANSQKDMGRILARMNRHSEALNYYQKAQRTWEKLEQVDTNPGYTNNRAHSLVRIGRLYRSLGKFREEEKFLRQGRDIYQELVNRYPKNLTYHSDLGDVLGHLAWWSWRTGNKKQAIELIRKSVGEYEAAFSKAPQITNYREGLNFRRRNLADMLLMENRIIESFAETLARSKIASKTPNNLYELASHFAMTGNYLLAKSNPTAEEKQLLPRCEKLALRTLEEAIKAGFSDGGRVNNEVAFNPWRKSDAFKQITGSLIGVRYQPISFLAKANTNSNGKELLGEWLGDTKGTDYKETWRITKTDRWEVTATYSKEGTIEGNCRSEEVHFKNGFLYLKQVFEKLPPSGPNDGCIISIQANGNRALLTWRKGFLSGTVTLTKIN